MLQIASVLAFVAVSFCLDPAEGEADVWKRGAPELRSAGALAFAPGGVLFVADPTAAAIVAIRTGDTQGDPARVQIAVDGIDQAIADLLGTTASGILINDLAVNPASGKAYLSVSRGRGDDALPVLIRVGGDGELTEFALSDVEYCHVALPNAPDEGRRTESITDLAFVGDQVIVAGLSNEEFSSKLRSIAYPFEAGDPGTSVEIYHGAHGAYETRAPVRTLAAYEIDGKPNILAAYTCTPLVMFPLEELEPGKKIRGTTVAELGNRNRPLDMVVYTKEGREYLLIANSSRGLMKVTTAGLAEAEGITEPVNGGKTAGLGYETIDYLEGVVQLDKLDDDFVVVLMETDGGQVLTTVETP